MTSGSGRDPQWGAFPRPFGDYVLLQPLDRGGMGQVYLAKHSKVDGIEKFCVVKTLRTRFTDDEDYVERFVDEARIVVHLGHRNICQVFDVGLVGERYYLAMEFVPGRDLRRVLDRAWSEDKRVPIELTLHVICQVLEALDYAHRHVHPTTGKPLGLVHRDVSPQNVMVNLEGEVKLIDFGLAATNLKREDEDTGVVMGKLGYMSPEQLCGDPVDARSDVFSTAILAYEMLVGARYYEGVKRDDIWESALDGYCPPRFHELPPGLREIMDRALALDPARRLDCEGFLEELERWRHEQRHQAGPRQLRGFMAELFPGEQSEVRELLLKYATTQPLEPPEGFEQSISIARSELTPGTKGLSTGSESHEPTVSFTHTERSASGDATAPAERDAEPLEESAAVTARHLTERPPAAVARRGATGWLLAALLGVAVIALLFTRGGAPEETAPVPTPPAATVAPAVAGGASSTGDAPVDDTEDDEPTSAASASASASEPATPAAVAEAPPATAMTAPADPPPAAKATATTTAAPPTKAVSKTPQAEAGTSSDGNRPSAAAAAPPAAPSKRMTFGERVSFLKESCAQLACAPALVAEFDGVNLPDVPTKRLATAVSEIRRCVEQCRAAR